MKSYRIFKHPAGQIEAVKQGWSWPGLFFTFVWAFIKRLWAVGATVLVVAFIAGTLLDSLTSPDTANVLSNVMGVIISLLIGLRGNIWRENNLLSRGYEHVDSLVAENPERAIAEYLKPAEPAPAENPHTPGEPPAA